MRSIRLILGINIIISFVSVYGFQLFAQSYNFTNYSLKEGLPQSQVREIYQAKDRTLWLGTFGGLSNFDGKEFTSYSKADGLVSNSVTSIVEDNKGQIVFGSEGGINVLQAGKVKTLFKGHEVSYLNKDSQGNIWGITENKLFKLINNKPVFYPIGKNAVTMLSANQAGELFIAVNGKGLYKLNKNTWALFQAFQPDFAALYITKILFDHSNKHKIYILTYRKGVFVLENGKVTPYFSDKRINIYHSIEQDGKGNIWVGSQKGAFLIDDKKLILHFNGNNGLSDNQVEVIFKDAENNIWISSFSDGFYKYEGDAFIRYNKFNGKDLPYPVSGIAEDRNQNLWIGTFNKGLLKYDGKKVDEVNVPELKDRNIYFVYADSKGSIWVSAQDYGVWKLQGGKFRQVLKPERFVCSAMMEDRNGGLWINNPMATLYIKDNKVEKITGFDGYSSCLYGLSTDSVLVGTSKGVALIRNRKFDKEFKIKALEGTYVLSIIKHGDRVLFATLGDGIVSWNVKTGRIRKYVVADGLNSNDIYSFAIDNRQNLWCGTGRGINKLSFIKAENRYTVFNDNPMIIECNQNAILNYKGNILVGTISGLIRCQTNVVAENKPDPLIRIRQVNVFDKNKKANDFQLHNLGSEDKPFKLRYNQNHLSITFKAVYLTNPQSVVYRYKLLGIDNDFSKPVPNTEIEYSAIRPGSYTFQVFALANGKQSNIEQFNFIIVPPFYDTVWFKVIAFVLIMLVIWLIFYLIFRNREKKKDQLETIKIKEQEKIRKQTAEDFHDDIGNKLTRINVLSEILDKKVNDDQPEQKELIRLIRENAGLLYTGTKDILWALDPQSDNLFEILMHIKGFGIDLFQNTGVSFQMEGVLPEHRKLHLSMEFNRNLTLIFKEMLNNVLKHAEAKQVLIMVIETEHNTINILTTDDGKGFDIDTVDRGRGLNNIQTRCKRIKSTFQISSIKGKGTTTTISTRIPVTK